ncbi:hypothetical protein J8273_3024 [Carpediemonas membranifera]|uniref:Homeobox domain-containing protein n=1 Tax=Carpediemonas membranifera TaxID=201153 RepID=A0A8J6BDX1_9EUKA|nr:hypothetical protein J8273_3024 [Carpediemonas membranifera]|eukprot:KAG9395457.1 hypothetical protein J8273_3024 [Carpediemonas membranifera]
MPRLPDKQSHPINTWFEEHLHHPYPSESDYNKLSAETGIDEKRIYNIIAQKRKRLRREVRKMFLDRIIGDHTDPMTLRRPDRGTVEEWAATLVVAEQYLWQASDKPADNFDSRYVEQIAKLMFRQTEM